MAHLALFRRKRYIKTVMEKELEAWPEKKLKSVGLFKILINILISSVLLGRNRATEILVRWVMVVMKMTNPNRVKSLSEASRLENLVNNRPMNKINKGIHVVILVTMDQKTS